MRPEQSHHPGAATAVFFTKHQDLGVGAWTWGRIDGIKVRNAVPNCQEGSHISTDTGEDLGVQPPQAQLADNLWRESGGIEQGTHSSVIDKDFSLL